MVTYVLVITLIWPVQNEIIKTLCVLCKILSWNKKDDQSFKIGKEIEDDFFRLFTGAGQRKNSERL